MHFGSYTISFLLHLALALVVFYWPDSPPVKLDTPMMQISINMGAPGGNRVASPVLGPQGKQAPTQAQQKPAPAEQSSGGVPIVREDTVKPKPEPAREKHQKPQPKPDAVAIPEKKEPKKPEPKEDTDTKDSKKEDKKKEPSKDKPAPEAKQSDKKKDGKNPQDALKDALADAAKEAGPRGSGRSKSSVNGALAEFEKSARSSGQGGGGAGEGDGPGGGGIYDVYMGQVILAVRPNWSMPTYSRQNFSVKVFVKLSPAGEVLECRVEKGSGRAEVDASAVNAVIRTKHLPKPPTPEQQELVITFNTQEMG